MKSCYRTESLKTRNITYCDLESQYVIWRLSSGIKEDFLLCHHRLEQRDRKRLAAVKADLSLEIPASSEYNSSKNHFTIRT
jgi:hypothetical protein